MAEEDLILKPSYKDGLLKEANRLRHEDILCDVTLQVGKREFRSHRIVLAASSPFFRALFTSEMKENLSGNFRLDGVSDSVMGDLLNYIYTGEIEITHENVRDLVVAGDFLIIPSLKEIGQAFLQGTLCPENYFSIRQFAEKYNCEELKDASTECICQHFVEASKTEGFGTLDHRTVAEVISNDSTVVVREEEIFEAVLRWVKYNYEARKRHFEELFKGIRVTSMSKYYLANHVRSEELVLSNLNCLQRVLEAMTFFAIPEYRNTQTGVRPRKSTQQDVDVIVCCGGYKGRALRETAETHCFLPTLKQWQKFRDMPSVRDEHAVTVCGNCIYVFGNRIGKTSQKVDVYIPMIKTWVPITRLPVRRHAMATVTLNGDIFVLGGYCEQSLATNQVFRFTPSTNQWLETAPMSCVRTGHCSVVLLGHIYVFGGYGQEILRTAAKYDPVSNTWADIAPMNTTRYLASATEMNGKALVVGGQEGSTIITTQASCEVYIPATDQWNVIADTVVPRRAAGIAAVGNTVYIIGGGDNEENYLDSMECYNEQTKKWRIVGKMPFGQCAWMQCGVLHISKELLEM